MSLLSSLKQGMQGHSAGFLSGSIGLCVRLNSLPILSSSPCSSSSACFSSLIAKPDTQIRSSFSSFSSSFSSFSTSQSCLRGFHSSRVSFSSVRRSPVSGASSVWSASTDHSEHTHSAEDEIDIMKFVPGKMEYLDHHIDPPAPVPTTAYVDNQLARLAAEGNQRHLLSRAIEERQRLHFAEAERRSAEDVYNDPKHIFGGDPEPSFNVWQLILDGVRVLVVGSIVSFTIYFFLLPIGKLFNIPLPNPALTMFLRIHSALNAAWQRWLDSRTAYQAGQILPSYENQWLDSIADKVIFKMQHPGAPLPPEDKLFLYPVVIEFDQSLLQTKEQMQEAIQTLQQQHKQETQH